MIVELLDAPERITMPVRMTVNGREIEASIEPRELLLDFLRDRLDLKGAKRSCDMQVCGTCTVLLDGVPASACCTLAYEARNREVTTIEGLKIDGDLHALQQAFVEETAVQCGFCTSGMILSISALLEDHQDPTREEIARFLNGNLCRCTGYWNIFEAIKAAMEQGQGQAS